ncbi:MAG: FHA domain-containing protein [Polyangiaceae bacterium]|nr:FHA domain-containing protein [Polyangiaceae bacterium]
MPVTLIVRADGGGAADHELTFDGARVVIGRGSGSDLWLPDPSVSHRHASVRANGSEYVVVDEGSSNGTWVGGVRLQPRTPRTLRTGDMLRVGRVWVEVRVGHGPVALDAASATRDVALALIAGAMQAMGDDVTPRIQVVEGFDVGEELFLTDDEQGYTVGRGEETDLALADPDTSREHIRVTRKGAIVVVCDLGSKNGTWLGERRLPPSRDVPWKSSAMVKIGRTVLALTEPLTVALAQLETMPDEPVAEEDAPPEPPPSMLAPPSAKEPAPASAVPPRSAAGAAAPMVAAPAPAPAPAPIARKKSGWTPTDIGVVVAAILIIALSLAGLAWVLKG